ncbi:sporulation protein YunB [Selenihalanaerobacter shriftii]|uniref:Sporulation protein YunB n=1 Tax=Selenihalanaerobacter shriftii TaxID=142842 RepID=A0A1T4QM07_9FIRM|nr:sporulation protein YunB [Selenihalanaerobacter shriftii]SKA04677.1 sporulation protein YunB [Selenihalanaerobacter shriftii]
MNITLKRLLVTILIVTILLSSLIVFLVEFALRPILYEIAELKASSLVTEAINRAVYQKSTQLNYDDLVRTKTDHQGNIIFMQPNLHKINQVSSQISLQIQESLQKIKKHRVQLPVAQMFGIQVLANYGPKLNAQIVPHGSLKTDIVDYFQPAGINQTRHKIDLEVTTSTRVVVPFISEDIKVQTTIPLTEAIIVGRVPEVYVGLDQGLISKEK